MKKTNFEDLKEGMYVKTLDGTINKIVKIREDNTIVLNGGYISTLGFTNVLYKEEYVDIYQTK